MNSTRLDFALRNAWGTFAAARAGRDRGADLSQWGGLSRDMAKIASDATDRRRRLWRMKIPALAVAASAAVALWVLVIRDTIPEDERSIADIVAAFGGMIVANLVGLFSRWHLDVRVARARQKIAEPPFIACNGDHIAFQPAHVLTVDGIMVAAIDVERRLVRVIAPVFFGFDVVFAIDATIDSARLTQPRILELPPVANMPVVTSDVQVASRFLIFMRDASDPVSFTIQEPDLPAAEKWMEAIASWIRDDAAWRGNLPATPAAADR